METTWPTTKIQLQKKSRISSGGNCQDDDVGCKCDATRSLPKKSILDLRRENGRPVSIILSKHKRYSNKATLSSYMWLLKSVSSGLFWDAYLHIQISQRNASCAYKINYKIVTWKLLLIFIKANISTSSSRRHFQRNFEVFWSIFWSNNNIFW